MTDQSPGDLTSLEVECAQGCEDRSIVRRTSIGSAQSDITIHNVPKPMDSDFEDETDTDFEDDINDAIDSLNLQGEQTEAKQPYNPISRNQNGHYPQKADKSISNDFSRQNQMIRTNQNIINSLERQQFRNMVFFLVVLVIMLTAGIVLKRVPNDNNENPQYGIESNDGSKHEYSEAKCKDCPCEKGTQNIIHVHMHESIGKTDQGVSIQSTVGVVAVIFLVYFIGQFHNNPNINH